MICKIKKGPLDLFFVYITIKKPENNHCPQASCGWRDLNPHVVTYARFLSLVRLPFRHIRSKFVSSPNRDLSYHIISTFAIAFLIFFQFFFKKNIKISLIQYVFIKKSQIFELPDTSKPTTYIYTLSFFMLYFDMFIYSDYDTKSILLQRRFFMNTIITIEPTLSMFLIVCPFLFLAGLVDAIGGGGGLISLPAYLIAGLPTHTAIATNKLSSTCGTTLATARFIKNGLVNFKLAVPSVIMWQLSALPSELIFL